MIGTMTIEEAAKQATTLPPDFGYYGDLDLGGTWGFSGFSVNRDSEALERSNFQVVSEHMQKEHPDDVSIMGASHWAVGWSDELLVKVYQDGCICTEEDVDDHREGCPEWLNPEHRITDAFKEILEFHYSLADYPVLDETLMSKIEHEELISYLREAIPWSRVRNDISFADNSYVEGEVATYLFDVFSYCHVDEVTDSSLEEAMDALPKYFYPICRECEEQDESGYIMPDGSGRCAACDVAAEVEAGDAASIVHDTWETNPFQVFTPNGGAALVTYDDAYDFLKAESAEHDWRHLNFYSVDKDGNVSDLNEIGFDIDYENQLTF